MSLHVAIIMDGNGRWANARGLPRIAGWIVTHRLTHSDEKTSVATFVLQFAQNARKRL